MNRDVWEVEKEAPRQLLPSSRPQEAACPSLRPSFPVLGVVRADQARPAPGDILDLPSFQIGREIDVQDRAEGCWWVGVRVGSPRKPGQALSDARPRIIITGWAMCPRGCIGDNYALPRLQRWRHSSISQNSSLSFQTSVLIVRRRMCPPFSDCHRQSHRDLCRSSTSPYLSVCKSQLRFPGSGKSLVWGRRT